MVTVTLDDVGARNGNVPHGTASNSTSIDAGQTGDPVRTNATPQNPSAFPLLS